MNHSERRRASTILTCVAIVGAAIKPATSLALLGDLPTPSFIIDLEALRRHAHLPTEGRGDASEFVPSIRCPKNELLLRPSMLPDAKGYRPSEGDDSVTVDCNFEVIEGRAAIGYLHSSVVRAREDAMPGDDDPPSTFLAEIDLDPALCGGGAKLVLGLNNHHVGGYYWARSAGAGSSMEAPGVTFGGGGVDASGDASTDSERGLLRWLDERGPEACNSNDGKRSEWANFLRRGDQVQLVPDDGQNSLRQFVVHFGERSEAERGDEDSMRVYGVSARGRPMGSEPEVVCEWRLR